MISESKSLKMSTLGWWMVQMIVLPLSARRPQQANHLRRVVRRQAGRRLVEEQGARIAQQLHRDVDALALAAADHLALGRADQPIADVVDVQILQDLLNARLDLVVAEVGAQLGGVVERFLDGELRVEDVVLRDVADLQPELLLIGVKILAVEEHLPGVRRRVAVQRLEQRRLAGAGRAHERDELRWKDGERNRIEQPAAHRSALDLDDQLRGGDGDVALIAALGQDAGVVEQLEAEAAEADFAALFQRDASADPLPVDERAVLRSEIFDDRCRWASFPAWRGATRSSET